MVEEETQKRIELLIKKRVDSILESKKHEIEEEIRQRVRLNKPCYDSRWLQLFVLSG